MPFGRTKRVWLRATTLLTLTSGIAAAAGAIHFHDYRRDYLLPGRVSVVAVASADLNNDGIGDILAVTPQSGVAVLLSQNAKPNYSEPVTYPAGTNPVAITVGDFNGDGNADVATANYKGNDVTVLFGAGNGTLGAPVHLSAGSGPVAVATADINEDGKPDLVVANVNGDGVTILYGNGDGTFQLPAFFPAGSQPASLAMGDFDSDGHLDIAVASQTGMITVLMSDGQGGFSPVSGSPSGASLTYSITAADFNGDGFLDLAAADQGDGSGAVYVCLGKGDGVFLPPTKITLPQYAPALTSADLNGDGHPDLMVVLSNQTSQLINALAVLRNDGSGGFAAPELDGTPEEPISIAATDLNHDGKVDVIMGTLSSIYSGQSYVSVILGRGDGSLAEVKEEPTGSYPLVATADFNGDAHVDLVVTDGDSVWVAFGNGTGRFFKQARMPATGQPMYLGVADVNGDGRLDIVTLVWNQASYLIVRLGQSGGGFGPPQSTPVIVNSGIAIGDLNGDGCADVVMSAGFTNNLKLYWGTPAGTFTEGPVLNTKYSPAMQYQSIAIGDFNADGKPDIAISTSSSTGFVELFPGKGDGTFADEVVTTVPVDGALAAGDMNGDGLLDLALSGLDIDIQGFTGVLLSNGDGTFRTGTFVTSPYWTGAIAVADFNGDGNGDVVVLPIGQQLVTFTGDGQGNLTPGPIFGAGAGAWTNLVVGDFLNTGKPGVAFGNFTGSSIGVVENLTR